MSNYNSHLDNMDSFSKSVVKPVLSDLADYSTAIIMKKASQKGSMARWRKCILTFSSRKTRYL